MKKDFMQKINEQAQEYSNNRLRKELKNYANPDVRYYPMSIATMELKKSIPVQTEYASVKRIFDTFNKTEDKEFKRKLLWTARLVVRNRI